MSFAPGILAALFGVPALTVKPADQPTGQPNGQSTDADAKPFVETGSKMSFMEEVKGIFKKNKGEAFLADPKRRMQASMVVMLLTSWLLFGAIALMALILYIKIQIILYRNSEKTAEQSIEESKRPYMDTLEYQVMNPSIFATYPYRALFYLSAIAFTLMILAYLFKIQLSQDANPGGIKAEDIGAEDDSKSTPVEKGVFYGAIISLYLFAACYLVIEKGYYTKIVDYNAKVNDFNQFTRSILPGNYAFLTVVSKASDSANLDNSIFLPALESLNANKREIVRGLCILNMYNYYHDKRGLYTQPGGVSNVLTCFNPINRILPVAPSCFSDHLINNASFIENKIEKYIGIIEKDMDQNHSMVKMFNTNRTDILMEVDKMMNALNQRGSCLGSTTAYNRFLTMNTRVFLLVWIPLLFIILKGGSGMFKKS